MRKALELQYVINPESNLGEQADIHNVKYCSLTEATETPSVLFGQAHLVLPASHVRLHHLHRVAVGLAERAKEAHLHAVLAWDLPLLDPRVESLLGFLLRLFRVLRPRVTLN